MTEADQLSFAMDSDWLIIPRVSTTIPFGHIQDPEDKELLLPVPLELEALVLAKEHLKQYSYREVAAWLSTVTGRYISHMGLKKRLISEQRRRTAAQTLKIWANRIEETRAKVQSLEEKTLGARKSKSDSSD